jgi:hypothetical protein
MKKNLLFIFIVILGLYAKLNAQCTVSNVSVEIVSYNPGTCQVIFNLGWQQETNNGNKFAYIHFWTADAYHTPASAWTGIYSNPASAPKANALVNSLGTISIFNNGTATPTIGNSYPADPTVTPMTGITVTKNHYSGTSERMTIKNIRLTIPGDCSGFLPIKADIWASQSANGKNVHCVSQGLTFDLHTPRLAGNKVCNPRSINFGITNTGTTSITFRYRLYADNGDGIFNPDGTGFDSLMLTSPDTTVAPGDALTRFHFVYPGANGPTSDKNLWLEVITQGSTATTNLYIDGACSPLPVLLQSFTARRNRSVVDIRWVTSTEVNNRGFELQRQTGTANWETISFIPSLAAGGNSVSDLAYSYSDVNSTKAICNYRLRQVDMDGNAKYSEIRSVRGEDAISKTVIYPNPSADGKVTVVFDDAAITRDVILIDMNGRTIKQWNAVSNNNIQIENLVPGFYSLRIFVRENGTQTVEKFVVNKR